MERWTQERANWKGADRTDAIFISRRGSRLSRQQAYRIIRDAGIEAGTVTQTHPHMLRHACGYELAERGADTRLIQDYLGIEIFAILCVIPPVMLLVLPDYGKEIIS